MALEHAWVENVEGYEDDHRCQAVRRLASDLITAEKQYSKTGSKDDLKESEKAHSTGTLARGPFPKAGLSR
jgi:hypothetical protein